MGLRDFLIGRGARLPVEARNSRALPSSEDRVRPAYEPQTAVGRTADLPGTEVPDIRCRHDIEISCPHCAAQVAAQARRQAAKPEDLEPAGHAQMVIRWHQEYDDTGEVKSEDLIETYPHICEAANVVPLATAKMLHALKKEAPKVRLSVTLPNGRTKRQYAYRIPKPKTAKVVAIPRRQVA